MFDLEKLIRTLRNHGVYRLEVTFFEQPSEASAPQLQGVGDALSITGLSSAVVEFFTPPALVKPEPEPEVKVPFPRSEVVHAEKKADDAAIAAATPPQSVPPSKPQEAASVDRLPLAAPAAAEPVAAAATPAADEPETSCRARKREKKVKPESAPTPSQTPAAAAEAPVNVYERFVETVEQDDGTKTDLKRELIGQMSLDDMLRVNNAFCLGLDTDVATEALRSELLQCFI